MTTDSRSALDVFIDGVRENLYLPDPGSLTMVVATLIASRLPGSVVWLLLVGPPSSGKSQILDALTNQPDVHLMSTLTAAGLITGEPNPKSGEMAVSGKLVEIGCGGLGVLVFPEFTTMLTENDDRDRVLSLLREVYDGKVTRTLKGGDCKWWGRVAVIGGSTEMVYSDRVNLGLLGERFVLFRLPPESPDDERQRSAVVIANRGRGTDVGNTLARLLDEFIAATPLHDELPALLPEDAGWLCDIASLGARGRSSVLRDRWSRDIDLALSPERPSRLLGQLLQLHAAMTVIGVPGDEIRRLLTKAALDGMHIDRRRVLDVLMTASVSLETKTVATRSRLSYSSARRHCEELHFHGVIDRDVSPETWSPSTWTLERWQFAIPETVPTDTGRETNTENIAQALDFEPFDLAAEETP